MNPPLVTCIIPVYNRENYITHAIESVINQTYENWELIVVDDRSTDNTFKLVQELASKNKKIHLVKNTRLQGPAGARNEGIMSSSGELLAFLDSDDKWLPQHLTKCVSILNENSEIDWISADIERIHNNKKVTYSYFKEITPGFLRLSKKVDNGGFFLIAEPILPFAIKNHLPVYMQSSVMRKRVFDNNLFNETLFGVEDLHFLLTFLIGKGRIGFIPDVTLSYYIHDNNISNSNNFSNDTTKTLNRAKELEKLWFLINEETIGNRKINSMVKQQLSDLYAWNFAYNAFLQMGNYKQSLLYLYKAISLNPLRVMYWKTFCSILIKSFFNYERT